MNRNCIIKRPLPGGDRPPPTVPQTPTRRRALTARVTASLLFIVPGALYFVFQMPSPATAQQATWRAEGSPPVVVVRPYPRNVVFTTATSSTDLTKRLLGIDETRLHPGAAALGLTGGTLASQTDLRLSLVERPSGAVCGTVIAATVTLGIEHLMVSVARDYPGGSCEYEVIVRHEAQHVDIHYRTLDEYAPRIERELARAVKARPVAMGFDSAELRETFTRRTDVTQLPSFKAMLQTLSKRHGEIDTPESYRRARAECSNW